MEESQARSKLFPGLSQKDPVEVLGGSLLPCKGAQLHGKDPISIATEFKTFGISKGMIWNEIPRDEGSAPTRLSISEFQGAPKSFQKHSPDPRLVEIMENPQGLEVSAQNVLSLEFQDEQFHL